MTRQLFVNLAVEDLQRTIAFYTALGFEFDPKYTDEKATCMIIGENNFAMLLVKPFFRSFLNKELCDAKQSTEVLLALTCGSRAEVDDMVAKAVAAGGKIPREPQDHGFMYAHAFEDLDGHIWEPFYMEAAQG
ncbi:MAG TPA: VOC family protein [Symbiobacteriaceae bacterium]|nr:VOC family protein [Symbiobacteriaceae bacterium]